MANAGPNTNGSQFFFCWKNSSRIPPNYTPFGTVIGGMQVLEKIAAAGDDSKNGPGECFPLPHAHVDRTQLAFDMLPQPRWTVASLLRPFATTDQTVPTSTGER